MERVPYIGELSVNKKLLRAQLAILNLISIKLAIYDIPKTQASFWAIFSLADSAKLAMHIFFTISESGISQQ